MEPINKSTAENTTEGMAKAGHFLLTSTGTAAKVFKRSISSIDVKSGTVTVVSSLQTMKMQDPKNADDYPDWSNVTLDKGVHIVDFKNCELSGATGVTQVNYGV